jgi:hypothetical protein
MEELIQDFQKQLAAHVAELEYIDEDWGQLDFYGSWPPVKFPCALIDIQSGQFTNDGDLRQRGVLTVVVRLYLMRLSNTSSGAPQNQKDKAKAGWEIYRKVNRALHGQDFLSVGFAAPVRAQMQRVKRKDGVYERDIVYTIGMVDDSCVPLRPVAPAQPTIRAVMSPL